MDHQEALPDAPVAHHRHVYCRGWRCGRRLTDEISIKRGYGPECDPDTRAGHERRDVDQDPIPGL